MSTRRGGQRTTCGVLFPLLLYKNRNQNFFCNTKSTQIKLPSDCTWLCGGFSYLGNSMMADVVIILWCLNKVYFSSFSFPPLPHTLLPGNLPTRLFSFLMSHVPALCLTLMFLLKQNKTNKKTTSALKEKPLA